MVTRPPEEFVASYRSRHERPATRALTVVGDVFYVAVPAIGLLRRSPATIAAGLALGAVVTSVAHVLQPGSLAPELRVTLRHPLWSAQAEYRRLSDRWSAPGAGSFTVKSCARRDFPPVPRDPRSRR